MSSIQSPRGSASEYAVGRPFFSQMSDSLMSSSASTGILADHDLVRPVHQLAEDVEEAMRALYQLHTALVNHFSTSPLIEDFRVRRDQFRAECEAIVALLRRCQDECNAFTFVLGNMRIAPKMQINAFIGRMVSRAQRISGEAHKLAATHHAACEDLRLKLDETRAIFPRLSPRQESSDSLHLYGRYDVNLSGFVKASRASAHPDGRTAAQESYTSLNRMTASIEAIASFWDDHVEHLKDLQSRESQNDVQKTQRDFKLYQAALAAATGSISRSSDAISVDPYPTVRLGRHNSAPGPYSRKLFSKRRPHRQLVSRSTQVGQLRLTGLGHVGSEADIGALEEEAQPSKSSHHKKGLRWLRPGHWKKWTGRQLGGLYHGAQGSFGKLRHAKQCTASASRLR